MKVVPGEDGTVMGYLYKLNEKEVPFTADQVFHMHLWNPYTPYVGVGPASAARLALENDFYAISYNKWAMTNADTPGGILTSDQSYTDKQVEELRRLWKKAHGHVTNKERTAILHSGLKWQDTALKPKDAQWLEGRRTNREEICTVFGVPPSMAGAWKSVNYATAKEERLWFWNETIIPILQFIQTCVTYFLIKPHYGPEYLVEYDLSTIDALKETLDKKIDAVVKLTSAGVPLNSALHEVDLAPKGYPFPWGNRAYISAALMPTEDAPDAGKSITAVQRMKATVDHNAIWKAFDARRRKAEVAVQKAVGMGLEDIADEAVANVSQSMPEILHEISPAAISAVVDAAEARRAIIDRMKPVIEAIYAAEAEHEAAQQEKKSAAKQEPYGWEDLGPEALRYLGLLGDKIKTVVGTMKDDLVAMARAITPEMLEEGVSLTELCRKIREIIGDREHYRAARIARTETGSIMNAAHQDVFSKSDVVHSKRWVSMRDQDVRDTHRDLDGHEVDKSDDFITSTGNRLRYPNDPDGVPEEIIQCRCTMIGVTD
jgi:SPP1 gp7 family putative phage head morphogenesis protein